MYSHVNTNFNDYLKEGTNHNYGENGEVKSNRGKVHEYLGMNFDLKEKAEVKIQMNNYVERIINEYPIKISKSDTDLTTAGNNIFEKGNIKSMDKNKLKSYIPQ